jgi:O-methyltransferase
MNRLDNIALAALSSRETLYATYDICMLALKRDVPGDFVECGVFGGAQAAAMALSLHGTIGPSSTRRVHLFDSFTGIPEGGEHDTNWTHPAGTSACSLEGVMSNMAQWGIDESLLVYHKALFSEVLRDFHAMTVFGERKIAVLRIDCDLYESTRVCIEQLYPLVSPGGWIICDDFALPGARKAIDDYLGNEFPPIYFQRPR